MDIVGEFSDEDCCKNKDMRVSVGVNPIPLLGDCIVKDALISLQERGGEYVMSIYVKTVLFKNVEVKM